MSEYEKNRSRNIPEVWEEIKKVSSDSYRGGGWEGALKIVLYF
jgi:hypothetical protein